MRALKALVIILGIAILVGTTVLVTVIIQRGVRLAGQSAPARSSPTAAAVPSGTADRALALPAGAKVLESRLGGGRVLLRAALPGGGEALFVFDAATGKLVARYDITRDGGP